MIYDLIIVGSGSVGSAAGYYASKAGSKVLMIDNDTPPHKNGSHHGATRLIRCAYGEGEIYVPLVLRAKELWRELNQISGQEVMKACGVLNMGPKDSEFITNAQACARSFNLNAENLTSEEVRKRWPGIAAPEDYTALYESDAGLLRSEVAIAAFVKLSKDAGAEQLFNTTVTAVQQIENGVEITTSGGKFRSRKALISAGTWVKNLLPELPIEPLRKVFIWHQADESYKMTPGFVIAMGSSSYYGFPADASGFKVGKHNGGQLMSSIEEYVPFGDVEEDRTELSEFMNKFMPGAGKYLHGEACTYDMSPDENFIIDTLPGCNDVMVVSGLSGHGFKFTSALGEIVAMFARGEQSPLDVSFFSLQRFNRELTTKP